MKNFQFSILFFLILGVFGFTLRASAAKIIIENGPSYKVGDTFTVTVKIDTEGQSINALDLSLLYPPLVSVKSISKSGSIIQLWVHDPSFTSSAIFFTGGVPGGFSGRGIIGKITLTAKAIGDGAINLSPESSVLLNDGQGSKASLALSTSPFKITPQETVTHTPSPSSKVTPSTSVTATPEIQVSTVPEQEDHIKPKPFEIFIGQDPRVFDGKYFAAFFTTDSESGMDHYELKEGDGPYQIATSPYLLSDQSLHSVIRIRAYDGAGNYREETYPGLFKRLWWLILKLFTKLLSLF